MEMDITRPPEKLYMMFGNDLCSIFYADSHGNNEKSSNDFKVLGFPEASQIFPDVPKTKSSSFSGSKATQKLILTRPDFLTILVKHTWGTTPRGPVLEPSGPHIT